MVFFFWFFDVFCEVFEAFLSPAATRIVELRAGQRRGCEAAEGFEDRCLRVRKKRVENDGKRLLSTQKTSSFVVF